VTQSHEESEGNMSDRERASILLESIPDHKIGLVIAYMEGLTAADNMPNEETIASMKALDNGEGESFSGSTDDFIKMMLED
jgi:hypothetical protein